MYFTLQGIAMERKDAKVEKEEAQKYRSLQTEIVRAHYRTAYNTLSELWPCPQAHVHFIRGNAG